MMQNIRPPTGGEDIRVLCTNCRYRGNAKLAGFPGVPSNKLKSKKCPKCGKNKLIIDYMIMY